MHIQPVLEALFSLSCSLDSLLIKVVILEGIFVKVISPYGLTGRVKVMLGKASALQGPLCMSCLFWRPCLDFSPLNHSQSRLLIIR